jgi:hypothetical protein
VIPLGDTPIHALWYLQGVERLRPDVAVVSSGHIVAWHLEQLSRRYPDIDWPAAEEAEAGTWLAALVRRNVERRPVCLTDPIEMRLPAWGLGDLLQRWRGVPEGLLFCLAPTEGDADGADRLARTAAVWQGVHLPSAAELDRADVHVAMAAFSYAVARFGFAGALAESGDLEGARRQLEALTALRPDDLEQTIARSLRTVGRGLSPFSFGRRAERALLMRDRDGMLAALAER